MSIKKISIFLYLASIFLFICHSTVYAENEVDKEELKILNEEISQLKKVKAKSSQDKKFKQEVLKEVQQLEKDAVTNEELIKISRIVNQSIETLENSESYDLQFDIFSDVHVGNRDYDIYLQALEDIKYLTPNSSATLFNGDNTDGGSEKEYADFYNPLKEKNVVEPLIILGNHEARWQSDSQVYKDRYLKWNQEYMGDTSEGQLYWSRWVEGYHFIGLNTELDLKDSAYLSPEQIAWVEKEIAIGAEPDKPIFLQIHQTFKGTGDTYDGDTIYYPEDSGYPKDSPEIDYDCEEALKEVLKKYPQVVIFTGHVHTSVNNLKVYPKEYGHVVDLPDFKSNLAYQVSVKDNEVTLKLRDYKNNQWIDNKEVTFEVQGNGTSNVPNESDSSETTESESSESESTESSSSETTESESSESKPAESSSSETTESESSESKPTESSSSETTESESSESKPAESSSSETTESESSESKPTESSSSETIEGDSSENDLTKPSASDNEASDSSASENGGTLPNSSDNGTNNSSSNESDKIDSNGDLLSNSDGTNNSQINGNDNLVSESDTTNNLPETGEKGTSRWFILVGVLLLMIGGFISYKKRSYKF